MEFSAAGNNLHEYLAESDDLRDVLQEVSEQGADFWTLNVRWRTGFNATHVEAFTDDGPKTMEGVVYASGYYARYREHGTRYNAAEHVMQDWIDLIEHT